MGVVLAPWPFLVGGAVAVEVALLLDGDVIEQRYLWRGGGVTEARDAGGLLRVRLGIDGFELLIHGVRDGVVRVGERAVSLRELGLCGVVALPIGASTTARLRCGTTELRVAGTTAPRRLPLATTRSGRDLAAAAVAIVAGLCCAIGLLSTLLAPPAGPARDREWYRVRFDDVAGACPSGHCAAASAAPPPQRAREPGRLKARAVKADAATATAKRTSPRPARPATTASAQPARAETAMASSSAAQTAPADSGTATVARAAAAAEAPSPAEPRRMASTSAIDAVAVALARAPTAGVLAQLTTSRAAFLGDTYVPTGSLSTVISRFDDAPRVAPRCPTDAAGSGGVASEAGGSGGVASEAGGSGGVASEAGGSGGVANEAGGSGGVANGAGASDASVEAASGGGDYGLGLAGVGVGGGGSDGTIGLGDLGTIGHGGGTGTGTGTGYGYGSGYGRLHGRSVAVVPDIARAPTVRGSCDAELIRRVVRAHVNELRFCYEKALQQRPELRGRVVAHFDIAPDGSAGDAAIRSSTLGAAAVDACVAGAIRRWQFPRCVAAVSYPFVFVPSGD
jgi:hypothetical protein